MLANFLYHDFVVKQYSDSLCWLLTPNGADVLMHNNLKHTVFVNLKIYDFDPGSNSTNPHLNMIIN